MTDRSTRTGTADGTLNAATPAPLALRPRDAARTLGISPRLLWSLTAPRGPIRSVRAGRNAILYPTDELRRWLTDEAAKGVRP